MILKFGNFTKNIIENIKSLFTRKKNKYEEQAKQVIKIFEDGIKSDRLNLKRLKPNTIKQKKRLGAKSPKTPLFLSGEYAENGLTIDKTVSSIKIVPNKGSTSNRITYKKLFEINEKNRPALRRSFEIFKSIK